MTDLGVVDTREIVPDAPQYNASIVKRVDLHESLIYVWVVINGMFPAGTPMLDLAVGFGIIMIWSGVILHGGLLATVVAISAHFILLRAPVTLELSSWRGTPGLTYLLVVGGIGIGAAYLARSAQVSAPRERLS